MAAALSSLTFLLVFPFFLLFSFTSSSSSTSSRTVASEQLKAWSKNVNNKMPNTILSKLSPLSLHDSNYFSSLIFKQSIYSHEKFCSLANLACGSNLYNMIAHPTQRPAKVYNVYKPTDKVLPTSHIAEDVDPFSFFRLSILKEGKTIHLSDLRDESPSRAFLPSSIASKISVNSNEIKRVFPDSYLSPITKEAIQVTLFYCNAPTLKGEIKSCPKSLEAMIRFSKNVLGENKLLALTSQSTKGSGKDLIIGSIKSYEAKKIVSCHEIFLPYATYYCHSISKSCIYAVDLLDVETKIPVNTVLAICHMDTSEWPVDHVAFKILKVSPGKTEACHWFSQIDLAWIGA